MTSVIVRATAGAPIAVVPAATIEQIALDHFDARMHPQLRSLALLPAVAIGTGPAPWCKLPAVSPDAGLNYYVEVTLDPLLKTCCREPSEWPSSMRGPAYSMSDVLLTESATYTLALNAETGQANGAERMWLDAECDQATERSLVDAVTEKAVPLVVSSARPPAPTPTPGPSAASREALQRILRPPPSAVALDAYSAIETVYPFDQGTRWVYRSTCRDGRFWHGVDITETVRSVALAGRGVLVATLERVSRQFTPSDVPGGVCAGLEDSTAASSLAWLLTNGRFLLRTDSPDRARRLIEMLDKGEKNHDFPDCDSALDQPELILALPLQEGDVWRCDAQWVGNYTTWNVLGQVSARTAAGAFEECHLLEWPWNSGAGYDWLCNGVGIVRDVSAGGSAFNEGVRELVQFSRPGSTAR